MAVRVEHGMDSEFESDEEERFFRQPPQSDEEHTNPSMDLLCSRGALGGKEESGARAAEIDRVLSRRARLQRSVVVWLATGSAIILVAAALRQRTLRSTPRPFAIALQSAVAAAQPLPPSPSAERVRSDAAVVVPPLVELAATARPVEPPSAESAPVASAPNDSAAAASGPAASTASSADAESLRKRASSELAAGRTRQGVASARAAIAADPADARAYLLLAAGLEDLGDWAGARAVFVDCRQRATRGPSSTCNYFARR